MSPALRRFHRLHHAVCFLVAVSVGGCENDRNTGGPFVMDSAGVRVVRYPTAVPAGPTWRVDTVAVFDATLRLTRTESIRVADAHVAVGAFADGGLLIWPFSGLTESLASPRVVRDTAYVALVEFSRPAIADTIARVPARPIYVDGDAVVQIPFAGEPVYAVGGDVVWGGFGGSGQITRHRGDGSVDVMVRLPAGPSITAADRADYIADDIAGYPEDERRPRRVLLERVPFPETLPSFDALLVDSEGDLWVREYRSDGSRRWLILDESGTVIGRVEVPAAFSIMTVLPDRILGVWRDSLNVETVRVYSYDRS